MNKENQDQILEKYKKSITQTLEAIQNDYKTNIIIPNTLYELNSFLTELKNKKIKTDFIDNQITNEHLYAFYVYFKKKEPGH